MSDLRAYQEEAIGKIDLALKEHGRTLLVAACGTGKTMMFSSYIARRRPRRALVLVHREELLQQARAALVLAGVDVQIERAEARASMGAQSVVASVPTLARDARLQRFPRDAFELVVVDEAHHAPEGTSYSKILDWFMGADVLGVTATPDRFDEKPLGEVFRSVAFEYEIDDAISDGWLCPIVSRFITLDELDKIRGVHTRAGDFVQQELDAAMATTLLDKIGDSIAEHAEDRPTIVFTVSVRQAEYMAARSRVPAVALHGEMDRNERARILDAYRRGVVQHLYNCAILTEGTDLPRTSCIAMARPTMSRSLYCQMLGRGLRLSVGKTDCLALDFVGNSLEHDTMSVIDALGVNRSEDERFKAYAECKEAGDENVPTIPTDLLVKAADAIRRANEKRNEAGPVMGGASGTGKRKIVSGEVALAALDMRIAPGRWGAKPMTEPQRKALERFGIDAGGLDRHQASALMGVVLTRMRNGLASIGQLRVVRKLGLPIDSTRTQASAAIDLAKRSRWHLSDDQIAAILSPPSTPSELGDSERAS